MRYMLLIYTDPGVAPQPGSPEFDLQIPRWIDYTQQLLDKGAFIAGDPLQGTEMATTVRERDGKVLHTDGPFAETKEQLGGYYLIDVGNLDEALAWAAGAPNVGYGSVEVRPLMDFPMP